MAIKSSVRRQWDDKVYEIRIWRSGAYVGNLGRLVRDLTWTVNRNPAVGYNELSFKVDQLAFSNWCQSHGVEVETIIKPIFTDCQIWVRDNPTATNVCVAQGYLDAYPSIEQNTDAYDYKFTFHDQFMKLQYGSRIPNNTSYYQWYADDLVMDLILQMQNRQSGASFGFTRGDTQRLPKIDRTYTDWKPVSEAIADMLDNETGAGQFDVWIDHEYKVNIAKPRGDDTGYVFHYPFNPALNEIPMASMPTYEDVPDLATSYLAVGSGQGDAAISAVRSNSAAINEYGYILQYGQFSSVTNQNTLNQKAQAELDKALYPDPAPTIAVNGVFVNWETLHVGDRVRYINDVAVSYGASGTVRIKTIKVNCDANFNESITLETETWNG